MRTQRPVRVKVTRGPVGRSLAGASSGELGHSRTVDQNLLRLPADALSGQRAVITGGTRGIGRAVAMQLALAGAEVVVIGRSADAANTVRSWAEPAGLSIRGFSLDMAQPSSVAALRDELDDAPVDIAVASAAVMSNPASKLAHTTPEHWRDVMAVNVDGVFHALAATVPAMLAARAGRAIALSACLGRMSGPGTAGGLAPYRVSKAAVNALVRNTAAEAGGGKRGVYVDAVCPGHCRTDMGGPQAPRSAEMGADTVVWLAARGCGGAELEAPTGTLWEDREIVPW